MLIAQVVWVLYPTVRRLRLLSSFELRFGVAIVFMFTLVIGPIGGFLAKQAYLKNHAMVVTHNKPSRDIELRKTARLDQLFNMPATVHRPVR